MKGKTLIALLGEMGVELPDDELDEGAGGLVTGPFFSITMATAIWVTFANARNAISATIIRPG